MNAVKFAFATLAAATVWVGAAFADPVALRPLSVEKDLQAKFAEDFGEREIGVLDKMVARALTRELEAQGVTVQGEAANTIEVSLVDARPSQPTLEQARNKPGLDIFRSISLGGAELTARITTPAGAQNVAYKWYEVDLFDHGQVRTTWSDARRAINGFARKTARAYKDLASGQ